MSWAEDAVRRVIVLHERTPQNTCSHCLEGFSFVEAQDWPCETLQAIWQLGHTEGPMPAPIQGPQLTWRQLMERDLSKASFALVEAMEKRFPGITPTGYIKTEYPPLQKIGIPMRFTEEQARMYGLIE